MITRRRRQGSETEKALNPFAGETYSTTYNSFEYPREDVLLLSDETVVPPRVMARDRTSEFSSAIRSLQGRHLTRAVAVQDPARARNVQHYGEFMIIAKSIGKNIASSFAKLEKLTLLAKRKPLFNDQPTEIEELTYIIKEDLNSLNTQIAKLQDVVKNQNQLRNKSKNNQLFSHSSSVVIALQSKLASMSSQFKVVLEVRTENLKEAKKRREQFGTVAPMSSETPSLLMAQDVQVAIDIGSSPQTQTQLVAFHDDTEQYLTSRAETMQNIESTIVELGGIFQQLAHMVKEQEEMVDRIDANVHDTELSVEGAHTEILRYFQSVTSNRWLMMKIMGVLTFFAMFFLIFLA